MRPTGEVNRALLAAARALADPDRSPTLRELAARSQVGLAAARFTVENMVRSGALVIVRTRRVTYRNRPVAEYAEPAPAAIAPAGSGHCNGALGAGGARPGGAGMNGKPRAVFCGATKGGGSGVLTTAPA